MNSKNNNNYISLREAVCFCDYSQEYLGLRARQGRLKSLKLGGTWVTKEEWLKEYMAETEERHNNAKIRIRKKLEKKGKKQRTLLKVFIILIAVLFTTNLFLSEKTFVLGIFKEYGQWVSSQTASVSQKPLGEEKEPILIKRIYDDKF